MKPVVPKYYEFVNKTKILSGLHALEHIPQELLYLGSSRPLLLIDDEPTGMGILNKLTNAMKEYDISFGSVFKDFSPDLSQNAEKAVSQYLLHNCDGLISVGDGPSQKLAGKVMSALTQRADCKASKIPFISARTESACSGFSAESDVIILDPRLSMIPSLRDMVLYAVESLCHSIEAYTCLRKNPLSDAYAFSAVNLIREYLPRIIKKESDRKARHGLANAALLSNIALMNSQGGITHAVAHGLTAFGNLSHREAIFIILPHCLNHNMIKLDQYYGELVLPLAGPEVFSDTSQSERGKKLVQIIRNMLSEFHRQFNIPLCLSQTGIKRSDFSEITALSLDSEYIMFNPGDILEEDILNILNLSY